MQSDNRNFHILPRLTPLSAGQCIRCRRENCEVCFCAPLPTQYRKNEPYALRLEAFKASLKALEASAKEKPVGGHHDYKYLKVDFSSLFVEPGSPMAERVLSPLLSTVVPNMFALELESWEAKLKRSDFDRRKQDATAKWSAVESNAAFRGHLSLEERAEAETIYSNCLDLKLKMSPQQ